MPEDPHEEGKPCLICQDTICSNTFHDACLSLTRHVNFSTDRVRGARVCRHPCSAFFSNRIGGSKTCCYLHSAFFSDRVRGARTCCLPCRTSDSDWVQVHCRKIGHEAHLEEEKKRSDDAMHFFFLLFDFSFFCSNLPDPRIISNFHNCYHQS